MRFSLLLLSTVVLAACQTTDRVTTTAAEGVEDATEAVVDAAGDAWTTVADVFDDDDRATAIALVRPTSAAGASAQGTIRFHPMGDDMMVMVSLSGLSPGAHGVHIHQTPACGSADADGDGMMEPGGAAGSHWDPLGTDDHGAATDGLSQKHLGDLGNVTAGANGTADATFTIEAFPSDYSVVDRAVIVHAGRDNMEQDPGGSSGARVGCGVVVARPM